MEQPVKKNEHPVQKKVYEAPKLARYGDLVEVTRSIVGTKGTDNAFSGAKTA
jgi:hypothetical protein